MWTAKLPNRAQLQQFVAKHSELWPQWNWDELIKEGIMARSLEEPVDAAVSRVSEAFSLAGQDQILITAWSASGLIFRMGE